MGTETRKKKNGKEKSARKYEIYPHLEGWISAVPSRPTDNKRKQNHSRPVDELDIISDKEQEKVQV